MPPFLSALPTRPAPLPQPLLAPFVRTPFAALRPTRADSRLFRVLPSQLMMLANTLSWPRFSRLLHYPPLN